MFAGDAQSQWDEIARLKAAVAIPVIGNGDVKEPADALATKNGRANKNGRGA